MYEANEGFKLGVCKESESIDQSRPHWLISRRVPRNDGLEMFIVGECSMENKKGEDLGEWVLKSLREGKCFYQDLNLMRGDKLDIFAGTKMFRFELRRKGWTICSLD